MAGVQLIPASDRTLLVRFDDALSPEVHRRVLGLVARLDAAPLRGIEDLSPACASVLVRFDPRLVEPRSVAAHLRGLMERDTTVDVPPGRLVEIAVAYGGESGPDLDDVARQTGLSPGEVVRQHTGSVFDVLFLGFLPGFAYIGPLPESIACARLPEPRRSVPAGSVGIAGRMTGVYPLTTPGGWRIIGRTEERLFDPARRPMALLRTGDRLRFVAVDRRRFAPGGS